eukprot:CAMPEP_0182587176 /NCGR_PEP_ID=MMETSP1324-20130603/64483_1 /TAXON_ID=236786 /ORGANISM="Florenciella sp., Strain RCC1587" /LENGTH=79 /DNA_ID=CAMNT_0024804145 /DNA_START=100 /DNA_END=336 /DNA_ORIENTATION=+
MTIAPDLHRNLTGGGPQFGWPSGEQPRLGMPKWWCKNPKAVTERPGPAPGPPAGATPVQMQDQGPKGVQCEWCDSSANA